MTWEPSRLVARAARAPRGRQILTPRVAALLAAAETADRGRATSPAIRWPAATSSSPIGTPGPRSRARSRAGSTRAWVAGVYRFAPPPDLIIFHRQEPAAALARALATRPTFGRRRGGRGGLQRIPGATRRRIRTAPGAARTPARGPSTSLVLDPRASPGARVEAVRDAVRPLLDDARTATAAPRMIAAGADRRRPAARPGAHGEPGVLFVLEGIDRSGRSTHVRRLEEHLRYAGRGVTRTSLASALLSGDLIRGAKRDRHADPTETALLYAADLAERVEQVDPALAPGRPRRHRRPVLLDADGPSRGARRGPRLARRAVLVRAATRRGPLPRRGRGGEPGSPRGRPRPVRGRSRPRAVGGPARELSPVRGAAVRLLRPLRDAGRLHPDPRHRTGRAGRPARPARGGRRLAATGVGRS